MSKANPQRRHGSGRSILISVVGLALVGFLAGTAVVEFRFFPYPQFLERAYQSLRLQFGPREKNWLEDWRVMPCRTTAKGVTKHSDGAFAGYTLFVSSQSSGAKLIDMQGREVHHWKRPFYSVWPNPTHIQERVAEDSIYSEHAHMYPNGDLLLIYSATEITPYGYGLAKLDKDSNLIWSYPGLTHHQLEVAQDGTIYVLTHGNRQLTDADRPPQLTTNTVLEDFVVALTSAGEELWKISLFDAIENSPEYQPLAIAHNGWDVLHTNAVRVIPEEFAQRHKFCRAGQLLVSFRSSDTLAVLDVEQRRIVWAQRGFWKQQHCPIFLPGGRLMIFDNQGFNWHPDVSRVVDRSRIVEFDPSTNKIFWEYCGGPDAPFYSKFRGSQQSLPNGNILITESGGGRIFEVTADKEIVWEYYNPERIQHQGQECVWDLPFARRFSVDECKFLPIESDSR